MTELEKVQLDMKLEVVVLGVSDVDRAKAFYEKLGWRLDIDVAKGDDFRAVQMTPHNSEASIIFGKGVTSTKPGSARILVLAVDDIDAARDDLIARGIKVSEVFNYAGGPFNNAVENPRVAGRDPQGRSYFSFASFEDPDGNRWLLQEITARLPGRGSGGDDHIPAGPGRVGHGHLVRPRRGHAQPGKRLGHRVWRPRWPGHRRRCTARAAASRPLPGCSCAAGSRPPRSPRCARA